MINPFKKNDKELLDFKNAERNVKQNLLELQRVANDLLADERYKKFANLIKEAEENTVNLLLRYKETDPYKYKTQIDEYLIELRVYRSLLNSTKDLSNPSSKLNPDFTQKFKEDMTGLLDKIK